MHARGPTSLRPLITHTAGPRPSRLRLAHAKQSRRARLRACQPASFCLALASAVEALAPFVAELQSMASRRAVRSELDVGSTWAPLPHATLWPCRPPAPPRSSPPLPHSPTVCRARPPSPPPPARAPAGDGRRGVLRQRVCPRAGQHAAQRARHIHGAGHRHLPGLPCSRTRPARNAHRRHPLQCSPAAGPARTLPGD